MWALPSYITCEDTWGESWMKQSLKNISCQVVLSPLYRFWSAPLYSVAQIDEFSLVRLMVNVAQIAKSYGVSLQTLGKNIQSKLTALPQVTPWWPPMSSIRISET